MDASNLLCPLADGVVRLEPLGEEHRDGLRAACAADRDIWTIMPTSFGPAEFDRSFDALVASAHRLPFAVFAGGVEVGMSGYLHVDAPNRVLEVGGTYMAPVTRGTGLNARAKRLLIDHAIACGFDRIEFRIDTRNARSMAAVAKLGAMREGVMRRQRITWTGHRRDTALFAILADEWEARVA